MQSNDLQKAAAEQKESWQSMQLSYVGNVSELVLGGGGKLSSPSGDPGDQRKPPSSG